MLAALSLLVAGPWSVARAQEAPEPAPAPVAAVVASARANARATMRTFLKAMNAVDEGHAGRIKYAAACLDLREINELVRVEKGEDLANTLREVIDRTRFVDFDVISDDPAAPPYEFLRSDDGEVVIARVEGGEWLFTQETVASLPALFKSMRHEAVVAEVKDRPRRTSTAVRMRTLLPDWMQEGGFLLEYWQWIGLFILVMVGMVLDRVTVFVVGGMARQWSLRGGYNLGDALDAKAWRPVGLVAAAIVWWIGLRWLALPAGALTILLVGVKFLATAAAVWAAYRFVDVFAAFLGQRAAVTESRLDDLLVPLVRRSLKVFIAAFGLVFIADNLDINVTSLLAGIGLGGLAFALAAKDTVENLFGSLTVILDRPFHIGDWVVIGDIDGTVESVGFRSTRIRTFYNSVITVPNSTLISCSVDNYGVRQYRRIKTVLSLTYDTPPEKIEAFCEGIRELLRRHPYTRKDYFHVYLNQFNASSLDVMLYCFLETPDWGTELRERERLFLDILRLAEQLEVQFAFPTQTLHVHDEGAWQTPPHALQDQAGAHAAGRDAARGLAREHWDGRTQPPPVTFTVQASDDAVADDADAGTGRGDDA